jgi:hypothetical protein
MVGALVFWLLEVVVAVVVVLKVVLILAPLPLRNSQVNPN